MSIDFTSPELTELQPRITVMGVGGAGGNAVNNMIRAQLQGVDFIVANTDAQALAHSQCDTRLQLGRTATRGLGAGSQPAKGQEAAEESLDEVAEHLQGAHMLFITAGMGGGTGTGAAPVIAAKARDMGILTVGVVTKPFMFEGARRARAAELGIEALHQVVDTLIVIPNQNLFRVATEKTTFADAFAIADDVLHSGVRGITDLMVMPGLINLDFADVKTVMSEMGKAMMGTGEAEGDNRAKEAAQAAISNPLLDEVSLRTAKGVIVNITGGMDLTLFEVDEAANHIRDQVDGDANIIVGSAFNESLNGQMRISVVATGIEKEEAAGTRPQPAGTTAAGSAQVYELRRSGAIRAAAQPVAAGGPAVAQQLDEAAEALSEQAWDEEVKAEEAIDAEEDAQDLAEEALALTEAADLDADAPARPTQAPLDLNLDDAYIPEAPRKIRPRTLVERSMAESEADEAPLSDPAEPESPGLAKSRNLFKKLSDRLAGGEAARPAATAAEEPEPEVPPQPRRQRETRTPLFGSLTPEDRPSPTDDQLQIPSFLRSQRN